MERLFAVVTVVSMLNPPLYAQEVLLMPDGSVMSQISADEVQVQETALASGDLNIDPTASFYMESSLSEPQSSETPVTLHDAEENIPIDVGDLRVTLAKDLNGQYSYNVAKRNSNGTYDSINDVAMHGASSLAAASVAYHVSAEGDPMLVLNFSSYSPLGGKTNTLKVLNTVSGEITSMDGELFDVTTDGSMLNLSVEVSGKPWTQEKRVISTDDLSLVRTEVLNLDVSRFSPAQSNSRYGFVEASSNSQNTYAWMIDFEAYAATGELPVIVGGGSVVRHNPGRVDVSPDGQAVVISYYESGADLLSGTGYEVLKLSDLKAGVKTLIGGKNHAEIQAYSFNPELGQVTVTARVRNADGSSSVQDFNYYYEVPVEVVHPEENIPVIFGDYKITLIKNSLGTYSYSVQHKNSSGDYVTINTITMHGNSSIASASITHHIAPNGDPVFALNLTTYSPLGGKISTLKILNPMTGAISAMDGEIVDAAVRGTELSLSVEVSGKPWTEEKRVINTDDLSLVRTEALNLDVSKFIPAKSNSRFGLLEISSDSQNSYVWMIDFEAYAATGEMPIRVGGGSIVRHNPGLVDVSPDGQVLAISYGESGADFLSGSGYEVLKVSDLKAGIHKPIVSMNKVQTENFIFTAQNSQVTAVIRIPGPTLTVSNRQIITYTYSDTEAVRNAVTTLYYNSENQLTRKTIHVYQADGKTLQQFQDWRYNATTGSLVSKAVSFYNAEGRRDRLVTQTYQADGVTLKQIVDARYDTVTGKQTNRYITYYDLSGKRTRYISNTYQADGTTLAISLDTQYLAGSNFKLSTSTSFYNESGIKTKLTTSLFQSDGVTLRQVVAVVYNPTTGKQENRYISDYDIYGRKTRYRSLTYWEDGKTLKKQVDVRYDPATNQVTATYTTNYDQYGNKI